MADRIVVMNEGRVAQIGAPLELYDRPQNTFVAGFIGSPSINFFEGTTRRSNGHASVELEDGTRLPLPRETPLHEGHRVVYGIRPEHLELGTEADVGAEVTVVEPTGPEVLVFSKIGGVPACAEFKERHQFAPGQEIRLAPRLENVHVFDAASGDRV